MNGKVGKVAAGIAAWMLCALPVLASPSETGALHVEGTKLVGSHGEQVQLRGISTHGLAWYPQYVNEGCFEQLRNEWNVDVIRLAMYTAESGGYCTDGNQEELKQTIQRGVEDAVENDLYVIIDWHILSDSNPNDHLEEAKAFFDEMSSKYAGVANVIYEICNEPNGSTTWAEIKSYAKEVIPVIRANDSQALILVGTPTWSQDVDQAAADPITDYDNIMYTLHFYAATHKEALRNKMVSAVESGLPVFVSEYGICDASGSGAIDEEEAERWIETMNEYGISYVAWNLSNKDETSAILKPSCEKTGEFGYEELSKSGQWLYRMLTGEQTTKNDVEKSGSDSEWSDGTVSDAASEIALTEQGLTLHISQTNSWPDGDGTAYQYNVPLENTSDQEYDDWEIEIPFGEPFQLKDGWNGTYTPEDNILRIKAKEYNSTIPAGGKVADIGFIVNGGGGVLLHE